MKNLLKNRFGVTDQGAKDLMVASLSSFCVYCVNMTPVILLMLFFEQLLVGTHHSNSTYYILSLVILLLMIVISNWDYVAKYNATYKESENLRIDISRKMGDLPLSYFSKHDLSDLAQTIMSDVAGIEHALSHAIGNLIAFIVFLGIITILLIASNVKLGLMVALPVILYFIFLFLSKKAQVKNQTKYYDKLRVNAENFQETIEMGQDIISYGMTDKVKKRLDAEMEESERIHIKSEFFTSSLSISASLILFLSMVAVIVLGVPMLVGGEINILYFLGCLMAAMKLKEGAEVVGMNVTELFYIDSMIKRINDIRNAKTQDGEDVELKQFDISLKDITFGYEPDEPILKDVTFTAMQGEITAMVGRSGCGKTSLLRLISRLYDYDKGSITIDGKDIKNISTKSLFDKVSIVFQEVILFNSSIMENIRIGNPDATDEEVKKAASLAGCQDFIAKLPDGYDTKIGENGASLSGGERQRISIARAFLKQAPIIILDEIAAALDVHNEQKIQESINQLTKDKTVLIISHRLKSIENVDKIVVIDKGRVESIGNHAQLMEKSGVYKDLVDKSYLAENFTY